MTRPGLIRATTLAGLLIAALPQLCIAQTETPAETPADVHWAYSAYFGTGWYSVAGDRDVFIFRLTPQWELTEAGFEDGKRRLGWHLKTPVSTGLDRFEIDDVLGAVDLDNVAFMSINPGVDLEIPVNSIWSLRPYASFGYGSVFKSSEYAWSYWAGIKSRVALHTSPRANWYLVNNAGYVGYTPNKGDSDKFWPFSTGLEVNHPMGSVSADSSQWLLHWNLDYTFFGDDVLFSRSVKMSQEFADQWELGAAIGKRDAPIKIWFLKFDRLGLGYRSSSNGDLQGITFIFRSSFER